VGAMASGLLALATGSAPIDADTYQEFWVGGLDMKVHPGTVTEVRRVQDAGSSVVPCPGFHWSEVREEAS
jgi:hypothetical protein